MSAVVGVQPHPTIAIIVPEARLRVLSEFFCREEKAETTIGVLWWYGQVFVAEDCL